MAIHVYLTLMDIPIINTLIDNVTKVAKVVPDLKIPMIVPL